MSDTKGRKALYDTLAEDADDDRVSSGSSQSAGKPNELCDGLRKKSSAEPRVLLSRSEFVWDETRNGSGNGFSVVATPKSNPLKLPPFPPCFWLSVPADCSADGGCSIKGSR